MNQPDFDFAIVGAGMAGASLAAEIAPYASVLLLEAEDQPGYHATGRSAAFWEECYGGPDVVPLTQASGAFLRQHGLLNPRGALYVGRAQDVPALDSFVDTFSRKGVKLERLGRKDMLTRVSGIREEWCEAIWQPECADIDVAALHGHYLSASRKHGAQLATRARLVAASHAAQGWTIELADGRRYRAARLVNAAGAWADEVAHRAGIRPVGITPFRRTVVQLQTDPAPDPAQPLVLDISGRFYFKPQSGRIWLSPHDEEPTVACDAAPEELAVAEAIDRFGRVIDWRIERIENKWAGLRSFAPDRLPVYGPDPDNRDFIWFAGQGGFGIQTAPAAATLTASHLLGCDPSLDVTKIDHRAYLPSRFR